MTTIKRVFRNRWYRFWYLVDTDNVVVEQAIFYGLIVLSGLNNLLFSNAPVQSMEESTTAGYYTFWLWLCVCGPLTWMVGKLLKGSWSYTGIWLQLTGDIATWLVFLSFVGATFGTIGWDKGIFGGYLAVACMFGIPVFIAKNIRKLREVEEHVSRSVEVGY